MNETTQRTEADEARRVVWDVINWFESTNGR
jgi:hypothetical protein